MYFIATQTGDHCGDEVHIYIILYRIQ